MHTNYVLAPLDYNHFITGCQIIILFPHGFSGMQESVLTAACSAGALALRSSSAATSAPIPGLADRAQAGWATHRSLACGPGCCSRRALLPPGCYGTAPRVREVIALPDL